MKRNFTLLTFFMIFALMVFGQENHWQTDYNLYSNNMSITAVVYLDGIELKSENIEIAAFCEDELRGNIRAELEVLNSEEVYIFYLTVCGEDGDVVYFKFYDHDTQIEFEMPSNETLEFSVNATHGDVFDPYVITFTSPADAVTFIGDGSWDDVSNWEKGVLPTSEDDVLIDGTAIIAEGINAIVKSLTINENKSLTIADGGILTVNESIVNREETLILEDGGQIYQTNDDIPVTFKKNIVNPDETWGELDKTGWQFISSPVQNALLSAFDPVIGDYDLYTYDGTLENEWYNFKKSTEFTFDNDEQGWTSVDNDGDGYGWIYSDEGYMYSESYSEDDDELTPENYLVSPLINIDLAGTTFKFKASAMDDGYPEYCGVFVSEDGETFTQIAGAAWEIGEGANEGEQSEWYEKTVDLSVYSGEEIYVSICHYNVSGMYQLLIDDIEFSRNGGTFEDGIAYMVSYQNASVAEFQGILNNETSYKMTANSNKNNPLENYNLFGNPFPYDINWETDVKLANMNDGYAMIKQDGGYVYKTDGVIKVGEGFMVNSKTSGRTHTVTMGKGVNRLQKNEEKKTASIVITATGNYGTDNVIIRLGNESRSAFNKLVNFNNKIANVYLKENDTIYGIYDYGDDIKEISLYFDAKELGKYTFTFDVNGVVEKLYLIDRMTGNKVNVLLNNEYTFTSSANDSQERFILIMNEVNDNNVCENFAYVNNDELYVDAEGTIQIIDVMGRVIITEENHDGMIDISSLNSAAYIVRCVNNNEVKTQKIVVL